MFVNFNDSPHHFTQEEKDRIASYGNRAAIAIDNSLLYEEKLKTETLLSSVSQTTHALTGTLLLTDILNQIADAVRSLMDGSGENCLENCFSHVAIVSDDGVLDFVAASPREALDELKAHHIDIRGAGPIGIAGRAVRERVSQNIGNVALDPDYLEVRDSIQSQLSVLLTLGRSTVWCPNYRTCGAECL